MDKVQQVERDIALIDELCSKSSENSCVEFKENNDDQTMIGKLCSALSNSARIEEQENAYLLWGIEDETHIIKGTTFDPDAKKVSNQVFQMWLSKKLTPSIALSFRTVLHPQGRVVILEIPAANSMPTEFQNVAYIRIGSGTPPLSQYLEHYKKLIANLKPYAWETGFAKSFILEDDIFTLLDYSTYFKLTNQTLPERNDILKKLEADKLIVKDVGGRWNITNLGAILFANNLNNFDTSLSRKSIRFVAYEGKSRATTVTHRIDGEKGYAVGLNGVVSYLNNILPNRETIGAVYREEHATYPEIAIRELIANALIHQDMIITGAGPQINLFSDRLEITNPGKSLIKTERMIDFPPRSRNEALASLMRRMKLCEEDGTGVDKAIISVEKAKQPAPNFQAEEDSMRVTLYNYRAFASLTDEERVRACFQHSVILYQEGERLKNASLCSRFGIDIKNASQITKIIKKAVNNGLIKVADSEHPRAGYVPFWV